MSIGDVFLELRISLLDSFFDGCFGGFRGEVFRFDEPRVLGGGTGTAHAEGQIAIPLLRLQLRFQLKRAAEGHVSNQHELHGLLVELQGFAQSEVFDDVLFEDLEQRLDDALVGHEAHGFEQIVDIDTDPVVVHQGKGHVFPLQFAHDAVGNDEGQFFGIVAFPSQSQHAHIIEERSNLLAAEGEPGAELFHEPYGHGFIRQDFLEQVPRIGFFGARGSGDLIKSPVIGADIQVEHVAGISSFRHDLRQEIQDQRGIVDSFLCPRCKPITVVILAERIEQFVTVADARIVLQVGLFSDQDINGPFDIGLGKTRERIEFGPLRNVRNDVEAARQVVEHDGRYACNERARNGGRGGERLEARVKTPHESRRFDQFLVDVVAPVSEQAITEVIVFVDEQIHLVARLFERFEDAGHGERRVRFRRLQQGFERGECRNEFLVTMRKTRQRGADLKSKTPANGVDVARGIHRG